MTGGFVRRVGWIRMGALGDLLVGLASLRETIEKWPDAKVSVIGPKLWIEIIEPGYWSNIDRIVVIQRKKAPAMIYEKSAAGDSWVMVSQEGWTLRKELGSGYDVLFNTRVDSPREGAPAFWARVPERWGAASGFAGLIYNRRGTHFGKDPLIHERDVPLLLMDEGEDLAAFSRWPTLQEKVAHSKRIAKWRANGLPCPRAIPPKEAGIRKVLINPTSSRREKAWPSAKFRELAVRLREMSGSLAISILGSPAESEWLKEVAGEDFGIVQPHSLGELFETVASAHFLVTNTSSVQFVAASVGTPTLTLMGRAKPEIWGPLGPRDRIVQGRENLAIESMFERERDAYESIDIQSVFQALVPWIAMRA